LGIGHRVSGIEKDRSSVVASHEPLMTDETLDRAAAAIAAADAILIGAGAGMGVDSGLPDFRGPQGFWRAYPPYERLGLNFVAVANPRWFVADPPLAWGFYGHRMGLYRRTEPHEGFGILRRWAERMPRGGFVFTSNVDGHFQRAGFDPDRIVEVHGAIDGMQCMADCGIAIFPSEPFEVTIDEETMRAVPPLPACPHCGALARPNILMFGDRGWDSARSDAQERRLTSWLSTLGATRTVIVELGAGLAVPTIRIMSEDWIAPPSRTLIRINPREPDVPLGHFSLAMGALAALRALDERLDSIAG
jgi:NAD-dependent SIR2 family protein deacetylase